MTYHVSYLLRIIHSDHQHLLWCNITKKPTIMKLIVDQDPPHIITQLVGY